MVRRGSCPRCNGRKIQHYVHGLPAIEAFTDDEGNVPNWIHFAGCVIFPGPSFDRSCDACGLRWNSWLSPRQVFATWREARDYLDFGTNGEAENWLRLNVAGTRISSFPRLDDPDGRVILSNGRVRKTLRFPLMHSEWESALLEIFDASLEQSGGSFRLDGAFASSTVDTVGASARAAIDSRFESVGERVEDLLNLMDVDDVGDIETLMMFLFGRPVAVDEAWDDSGAEVGLEFVMRGENGELRRICEFPMSALDLAAACGKAAVEIGPDTQHGLDLDDAGSFHELSAPEAITALQRALGNVRLFNMMDSGD
jgi:hypothetical protein